MSFFSAHREYFTSVPTVPYKVKSLQKQCQCIVVLHIILTLITH